MSEDVRGTDFENGLMTPPPTSDALRSSLGEHFRWRGVWTGLLVFFGYLALTGVLSWPLALHLTDSTVGFPSPDNMDM